jgi:hypothetical protein
MKSEEKKIGKFGMSLFFIDILLILIIMLTSDFINLEQILPDFLSGIIYLTIFPGALLGFFFHEDLSFIILPVFCSPVIWLFIGMIIDKTIARKKRKN